MRLASASLFKCIRQADGEVAVRLKSKTTVALSIRQAGKTLLKMSRTWECHQITVPAGM